MLSLSRIALYNMLIEKRVYSDDLHDIININRMFLERIEPFFLSEQNISNDGLKLFFREKIEKDPIIFELFKGIIHDIKEYKAQSTHVDVKAHYLCEKIEKIFVEYVNKDEKRNKNARYFFNKLINALEQFNDDMIKRTELMFDYSKDKDLNPVFLSYAYKDKLYTLGLFELFRDNGIYLYIDWMHNDKINDGAELKRILLKEMSHSKQFLFFRTINSELGLPGNYEIRPWCAWELGNYYNTKKKHEKYLISLYSVKSFDNPQLHGVKVLTDIVDGKMIGYEICQE